MIAVIDSGLGNTGSIGSMLRHLGIAYATTARPEVIDRADRIILPGVGAFDAGVESLRAGGLFDTLKETVVSRGTPILGICLGMQLLTMGSEEGHLNGLGLVAARTVKFDVDRVPHRRLPHMGWNTVTPTRSTPLVQTIEGGYRYYFVHSYHVICSFEADVLGVTEYGYEFTSAFQHENIVGVQFHPEKSHRYGMTLLKAFAEMQK